MGYYPKHLRKRRQRWEANLIARAALAGAVFKPHTFSTARMVGSVTIRMWSVPGSISYESKVRAAAAYLIMNNDRLNLGLPARRSVAVSKGRLA